MNQAKENISSRMILIAAATLAAIALLGKPAHARFGGGFRGFGGGGGFHGFNGGSGGGFHFGGDGFAGGNTLHTSWSQGASSFHSESDYSLRSPGNAYHPNRTTARQTAYNANHALQ